MVPEFLECIETAQDILYQGFIASEQSGIKWLDTVCAELHRLLRIVHKYLIFDGDGHVGTLETCFLCISQIVTCIRWLEKTITLESQSEPQLGLPQTRQCFLDRIIWCLGRLKDVLENDGPYESVTDSNFVSYLDLALNLISPLTVASEEGCVEDDYERKYDEVIVQSGRIRSVVEALISQTFGFCNVLPEEDRKLVTSFCQKVLKECLGLERESSEKDSSNKKLRVSVLESAIYQLEIHVNECLLRLVYDTFGDTDGRILSELRAKMTSSVSEDEMDELTKPFDTFVERLMQIGLFAISYADNLKVSSAIRSCLASIEALDSYLIPSLYLKTDDNTMLLERHWLEETANLCHHVHKIIDSNAFALALIEQIDAKLDTFRECFDLTQALEMVRKVEIFQQHLDTNSSEMKLEDELLHIHLADYRTMVLECRAIVTCAERDATIASSRIIKRFRVLLGKLRKIQAAISNNKSAKEALSNNADTCKWETASLPGCSPKQQEVEACVQELFSVSQGRLSATNILYRSRRGEPAKSRLEASSLLEINTFTDIMNHRRKRAETTPEKGSIRKKPLRRNSLRIAMFKKQQRIQTAEMYESIKSDVDLQITKILDELTDLSHTFSQAVSSEKTASETPPSSMVDAMTIDRKSITNEEIAIADNHKIRINIYTEL
ncbi:serendipity locus protein alpha-like [Anopheles nili]|uniref:serendipity locus protein alpha-like n=1 Tax=Anopheles nili TaxID=185578 RepID=UPI00237BACF2|nr:serendipity locus protein alpha-like [Anopheles nili]